LACDLGAGEPVVDISLITSLFRAEAHWETYTRGVADVARQLKAADVSLEMVLVANDPSEQERSCLHDLADTLQTSQTASVVTLEVPRETIYASWNRGVRAAAAQALGIWNVDDRRTAEGLIEGYRLIAGGCEMVEFPFVIVRVQRWLGLFSTRRRLPHPPQYTPSALGRKTRLGTFFMFSRALYDAAGPFDEHFRISGDFEWCARPRVRSSKLCIASAVGGYFSQHSANLSGTHSALEHIEDNVVLLRYGMWRELRPVEPQPMQAAWTTWGDQGTPLPQDIQDRLWGAGANETWQRWQRDRRRQQLSEMLRCGPRWIIDRLGLRSLLERAGIVKSSASRRLE
jgi:hypothetical protein